MLRTAPTNPTTAKISKIDWRRVGRCTISRQLDYFATDIGKFGLGVGPQVSDLGPHASDLGLGVGP
jgi:hypothetical protein